ncbi:uncharacterized protein LOC119406928 isoform X2 [Rhipicephalus sanguineus]|uniref:uncharacterized protein LOC119406928 isoform X2 n=1 Tax=Rhipicephalus sanguineus TaxID=34632 RepID=UPI0018934387|nr:uncharacterized protein LOC119406928 isoform X2 [Rhipicephalus sanguineus]
MNRRGTKATSSSKLARSTTATDKDGKPCARRMERKLSLQKINTTSCCRTLQDSRPTGSRTEDRHAACKAAPTPSGFIGPEWNDSTRISPRDRKPCRNWVQSKKNTFTKSTKKAEQGGGSQEKTKDTQRGTTTSPRTSGQPTIKLPDFSFLFKPTCFSPECSDMANHFPIWPQKAKSVD